MIKRNHKGNGVRAAQAAKHKKVGELWGKMSTREIALTLGYTNTNTVTIIAQKLGLYVENNVWSLAHIEELKSIAHDLSSLTDFGVKIRRSYASIKNKIARMRSLERAQIGDISLVGSQRRCLAGCGAVFVISDPEECRCPSCCRAQRAVVPAGRSECGSAAALCAGC